MSPGRALAGPNEGDFFGAANGARSSAGLAPYTYAGDLAAAARAQAERMAASGQLEHNPDLGGSVSNWQELAENIGVGPDWQSIQQALMNSPDHRAAILDSGYTQMGVGTAVDNDGTLWVSEVFRLPAGATAPAPSTGSSSNTSTSPTSSTSATSTPSAVATPTPTQILRSKIKAARDKVE
ncbi:MAG: CAP domain-containing protein, partial [Candidatus Nanopelagicales bacterium]